MLRMQSSAASALLALWAAERARCVSSAAQVDSDMAAVMPGEWSGFVKPHALRMASQPGPETIGDWYVSVLRTNYVVPGP